MKKEVKDLFRSIKEVSSNMGWRVYEVGAYLKQDYYNIYNEYILREITHGSSYHA